MYVCEERIKMFRCKAISYSKQLNGIPALSLSLTLSDVPLLVAITAIKFADIADDHSDNIGKTILSHSQNSNLKGRKR